MLSMIFLYPIPESPTYLVGKNKLMEAKKSIRIIKNYSKIITRFFFPFLNKKKLFQMMMIVELTKKSRNFKKIHCKLMNKEKLNQNGNS